MSRSLVTIILAAGKGKRMKSDLPKVLHPLANKPLVHYVIELASTLGSERTLLVVGHGRDQVIEATRNLGVEWVIQDQQLGTGHAVAVCKHRLAEFAGDLLVLSGDVPLLQRETMLKALDLHRASGAAATVLTFRPDDPHGYGRILRGEDDRLIGIVEERDATETERRLSEVNSGVYLFQGQRLLPTLDQIGNDNASGEYYLTDCIKILARSDDRLSVFFVDDPLELAGINDQEQLDGLDEEYRRRAKKG